MPCGRQPPPADYLYRTRELPVNLLFLAPWIVLYELCLLASRSPVENAAGAWVKTLLATLGRDGLLAVGLLLCGLLCMVVLLRIREAPRDRGVYGGMLVEGLVYGSLLGLVAKVLASRFALGHMVPLGVADSMEGLRGTVEQLGLALGHVSPHGKRGLWQVESRLVVDRA